jgi:hypothetical protein
MSNTPKPQLLLTGLTFGESPRWHAGRLWVSGWGTRELIAVSQDGKREVMVKLDFPSFQPICMDWLPDGRLLIVSSGDDGPVLAGKNILMRPRTISVSRTEEREGMSGGMGTTSRTCGLPPVMIDGKNLNWVILRESQALCELALLLSQLIAH